MEQADLNSAHLFAAVVERGSFTGAAKALELPKSTVSRKIAELETRLGARLLQRTTRQLSLTDLGALYFERVKRVIAELSEAEAAVTDALRVPRGVLRVTAPPDLGMTMLAWSLPEFSKLYPEVQLALDLSGRTVDLVQEGFDVALRAGHLADSSLIAKPVFTGTFALYASPDYLNAHGRPTSLDELRDHDTVLFGTNPDQRLAFDGPNGREETLLRGRLAIKDFGYLRLTAVAGAGIAYLPNFLVGPDLHFGRLERVLPAHSIATDTLYVVYPSREFLPAKTRAFVDFVIARFSEWDRMCEQGIANCRKMGAQVTPEGG